MKISIIKYDIVLIFITFIFQSCYHNSIKSDSTKNDNEMIKIQKSGKETMSNIIKNDYLDELIDIIKSENIEEYKDIILKGTRECYTIDTMVLEDYSEVGNSRFAGDVDFPVDWEYPYHNDKYLLFVAQINLKDIGKMEQLVLPETGILYFFIGSDESNSIYNKVLYYNGDFTKLKRTPVPSDKLVYSYEYIEYFTAYKAYFRKTFSIDVPTEINDTLLENYGNAYDKLFNEETKIGDYIRNLGDIKAFLHKNGLSNIIYNFSETITSIDQKIATLKNGENLKYDLLYYKDFDTKISILRERKKSIITFQKRIEEVDDWIQLFKLSSHSETNMQWGDNGYLQFIINKNDLKDFNFDNVFTELESS